MKSFLCFHWTFDGAAVVEQLVDHQLSRLVEIPELHSSPSSSLSLAKQGESVIIKYTVLLKGLDGIDEETGEAHAGRLPKIEFFRTTHTIAQRDQRPQSDCRSICPRDTAC